MLSDLSTSSRRVLVDRVSLTGPDDRTALADLATLSKQYPFVEWALLYVPHNEGAPRNPQRAWREAFFDANLPGFTAVHLCGSLAFTQLLEGQLPADVLRADRLQLNVNPRRTDFADEAVLEIYRRSLDLGPSIILQHHEATAALVRKFLTGLAAADRGRVHVLLDESKGTGKAPAAWRVPDYLQGVYCGFAGGLGPHNIAQVMRELHGLDRPYWPDMESGIRTDNRFDIEKARQVLAAAQPFVGPYATAISCQPA